MPTSKLTRYPRPSVAVDVAVLTVVPGRAERPGTLAVLIQDAANDSTGRVLPGRFLREGQTIEQAVVDVLMIKAGLSDVRAEARLLRVFDEPGCDPRGWTLSLAHSLTLAQDKLQQATGTLVDVAVTGELTTGESLLFDHDAIIQEAAAAIRDRYEQSPDPDGLLGHPFTMAELKGVHEAVIGAPLLKDTFRRRMEPQLRPLTDPEGARVLRSDGGRPAQVYVRHGDRREPVSSPRRLQLPRARR